MNRSIYWLIGGLIIALFALPSFAKSLKLNEETVTKVGTQPLVVSDRALNFTVGDVFNRISQSRLLLQGGLLNADGAKRIIDSLVVDSLTTLEADKVDLRKYPLSYRSYRHQVIDSLVQAVVALEIDGKVQADSAEVLQFFHDNPDLFTADEQVRLWHILISPSGMVAKADSNYNKTHSKEAIERDAEELVWSIWQALNYGENFKNMAFLFSQDILSAKKSGFVGWTTRGQYIDPFDSVAFTLPVGTYSRPYHDKDGWHIIWIEAKVPAGILPIDSAYVYDVARSSLLTLRSNQRGAAMLDSLFKAMPMVESPAAMNADVTSFDDTVRVATLGDQDTLYAWEMKQWEQGYRLQHSVQNTTPEMRRDYMRQMARRYVMARAAEDLGITKLPPVARYEREIWLRSARDVVSRRGEDLTWVPDDSTVERIYREQTKSIDTAHPITVQAVMVKDSVFAVFLKDQANSGVPFEDFVKKDFLEAVNPNAKVKLTGIKKVGQKDVPPEFWKGIFGIDAGKVSGVFRVKNDFYVAKVLSRIQTINVLSSKGNIRVELVNDHRRKVWEKFRDELYKTYNVRFATTIESLALKPYRFRNANRVGDTH